MTPTQSPAADSVSLSDAALIALLEAIEDSKPFAVICALSDNVRDELEAREAALRKRELDAGGGKVEGWPECLMIRDTKIHDDMGGLGQRIFTTAGAGYEKIKYVRADLAQPTTPPAVEGEALHVTTAFAIVSREHGGVAANGDGQYLIFSTSPVANLYNDDDAEKIVRVSITQEKTR